MISIFYPANSPVGVMPERYWERAMSAEMSKWYAFSPNPSWFSRDYNNAPLAASANPWPILLYSPSLNSERRENLYKLLELASHGFVVATTDHRETFASAFPNGTIVPGVRVDFAQPEAINTALTDRVQDVPFVLGELTRMNREEAGWIGRLGLTRVGVFGFSFGGMTAAELCRTDARIGAGMDGISFIPALLETPLPKPFMFLRSDQPDMIMPDGRPDDRLAVIEKMTADGYFIQLSGTVHWSFADYPLLTTEEDFQAKVGSPLHPLLRPTRINELSAGISGRILSEISSWRGRSSIGAGTIDRARDSEIRSPVASPGHGNVEGITPLSVHHWKTGAPRTRPSLEPKRRHASPVQTRSRCFSSSGGSESRECARRPNCGLAYLCSSSAKTRRTRWRPFLNHAVPVAANRSADPWAGRSARLAFLRKR